MIDVKVPFAVMLAQLLMATLVAAQLPVQPGIEKPNVVIFLIDDLGRTDTGVDGSTFHETPHLDALARSGVRFTDFYSAHPVCSPTRAALMTGKVPQRLGITDWIHPSSGVALPHAEITLGESFQSHGYQTAYFGKWHLGEADGEQPTHHGFEWIRGVNRGGHPGSYYFPFKQPRNRPTVWDVPDFESGKENEYLTDALTTSAIEFIQQREPQRPFLMCLGHYAMHTPIQPPAVSTRKYQAKFTAMFGDSETPTQPAPFAAISRGRQDNADYAAMMENLDHNIGRVLKTLDELHLRQNTVVVFTSDNGGLCTLSTGGPGPTCNLPWRSGKGWNYEGGIRISTFFIWPGHLAPSTSHVPAFTADIYPTLLDLCGLPLQPQQHIDGQSLVSALRNFPSAALRDRPLAWYYPHDHGSGHKASAAIRRSSRKLIFYFENEEAELYDLERDPGETRNLIAEQPETARSLRDELLQWIADTKR
jgi:arylsulfatase A